MVGISVFMNLNVRTPLEHNSIFVGGPADGAESCTSLPPFYEWPIMPADCLCGARGLGMGIARYQRTERLHGLLTVYVFVSETLMGCPLDSRWKDMCEAGHIPVEERDHGQ
jgi:hypothetical protein